MDELDRPGDIPPPKTLKTNAQHTMGNRPPVAMDQSDAMDEVDQVAKPTISQAGESGTTERPSVIIPAPGQQQPPDLERKESEILSSIAMDETPPVFPTKKPEKPVEEMLSTIDIPFDNDKFQLEEIRPESPGADATDAPVLSQTDGPFTSTFFKPAQPIQQLVQHRSERKNREGITIKHTTYHPKPLEKNSKMSDHASNIYSDSFYKMDCFPRGKLTLINVKHFTRASGMGDYPREGTNRDAEGLTDLFLDLGFVVDRFDNPSKKEILAIVKAAANEDYSKQACCACAILSHGEEGIIYGNDDFVKIRDITKMFRTRGLAGKPKFFLFQACQGSEYMNPYDAVDGKPGQRLSEEEMALTLPSEADFLYAYSTVPGYYSWRNSRRGSWFMEALVQVFRENAHRMDVMRMLIRVNDIISYRKSRTDEIKTDNKRQIASLITQMRKDFFLFPPYGPLKHAQ
ncbi:caspase-3-like isoform X2 [Clytia hemisphaerica]|uniref:Uncharacterized protein n=2 Tax=Clytia hemisphaerica TaxID=252671 RepID=A0A7M5V7I5_9CNID